MSSSTCSARSFLFLPFLTLRAGAASSRTAGSNTAGQGLIVSRNGFSAARCSLLSTPAFLRGLVDVVLEDVPAAELESSTAAPAARTRRCAGSGCRCACPGGWSPAASGCRWACDSPLRIASTPATNVVATAPMPGSSTPSFPLAGRISRPFPLSPSDVLAPPRQASISSPPKSSHASTDEPTLGASGGPAASALGLRRDAAGLAQELERGGGQLAIVARSHEAALADVVVKDARARAAVRRSRTSRR